MLWVWLYNQPAIVINVQDVLVPCFASFSSSVWRKQGREARKSSPGSAVITVNRESANRERLSKQLCGGGPKKAGSPSPRCQSEAGKQWNAVDLSSMIFSQPAASWHEMLNS
uniref:Uncharacterized protein n=1 Tax=Sphaerodactylus townsendi TaxID=933632 RepID=A0ACB8EJX1_9SAUR